ncbi:MAG: diaminopimelate decarboxylase [Gemmatimonadota bacterium]|nr:diaminopimelate decarboxylase [Gemmatimonadota bacterium]
MGQVVLTPEAVAPLLADAGLARAATGALCAGTVSLAEIAGAVGTPTFVYHADVIEARYRELTGALAAVPHTLCYAIKANSNLAVLRFLAGLGAGADIVSVGELTRALRAGFPAGQIVFSGVGKRDDELLAAVTAGVGQINAESLEELARLAGIVASAGASARVGLRINPDVTTDTHPYISTGKNGIKFGVPADQVVRAAAMVAAAPGLTLTGVAVHLGSQLLSATPYQEALDRLMTLLPEVQAAANGTVTSLGLGGGIGIRYTGSEQPLAVEDFAAAIVPGVRASGMRLHLEPGRYLVGSSGVLLTRVLYRKHSGGRDFMIVDAAMNDLVRPSHYQAHHAVVAVGEAGDRRVRADVVGPICETGDFLALDRDVPDLPAGSCLAILGAGAYGFSMSSQYNSRPRAAEVLVHSGRWGICRRRETIDDLMGGEVVSPLDGVNP